MTFHSSGVSGPGLSKIWSGTAPSNIMNDTGPAKYHLKFCLEAQPLSEGHGVLDRRSQ